MRLSISLALNLSISLSTSLSLNDAIRSPHHAQFVQGRGKNVLALLNDSLLVPVRFHCERGVKGAVIVYKYYCLVFNHKIEVFGLECFRCATRQRSMCALILLVYMQKCISRSQLSIQRPPDTF